MWRTGSLKEVVDFCFQRPPCTLDDRYKEIIRIQCCTDPEVVRRTCNANVTAFEQLCSLVRKDHPFNVDYNV